ncbi:hypothetical protein FRC08_017618 [Ceratobasidium sp. 394]|nr:hypothetical protein FRC08_017618 [Ceratobasidium sp. 394]KAG9090456.1 hypothetical protein FS749_000524 [Ceratobasidium sp. UAMH 11750]
MKIIYPTAPITSRPPEVSHANLGTIETVVPLVHERGWGLLDADAGRIIDLTLSSECGESVEAEGEDNGDDYGEGRGRSSKKGGEEGGEQEEDEAEEEQGGDGGSMGETRGGGGRQVPQSLVGIVEEIWDEPLAVDEPIQVTTKEDHIDEGVARVEKPGSAAGPTELMISDEESREQLLAPIRVWAERLRTVESWNDASDLEMNPLYLLENSSYLWVNVFERVMFYLYAHSIFASRQPHRTLVIPPTLFQTARCNQTHLNTEEEYERDIWHHPQAPTYVILPINEMESMDPTDAQSPTTLHWYIYFGPVVAGECHMRHMDSTGPPGQETSTQRWKRVQTVMRMITPTIKYQLRADVPQSDRFLQRPGSNDCGFFVLQAVSAALFDCLDALENPLPVEEVKARIRQILHAWKSGIMAEIAGGGQPAVVNLLHRDTWAFRGHVNQRVSNSGFRTLPDLCPVEPAPPPAASPHARPPPWKTGATAEYERQLLSGQIPPTPSRVLERMTSRPPFTEVQELPIRSQTPCHPPAPPPFKRMFSVPSPTSLSRSTPFPTGSVRFSPAGSDVSRAPSGFSFVLGRSTAAGFPPVDESKYADFFAELEQISTDHPVGMLQGIRARNKDDVLSGACLLPGRRPSQVAAGVTLIEGPRPPGPGDHPNAVGIAEFRRLVMSIQDGLERDRVLLTGRQGGRHLKLDWRKDNLELDEDVYEIAMDIDSLSLTVQDPVFTSPVSVQAYPSRAKTLTTDNHLRVLHRGVETPLSHCEHHTIRPSAYAVNLMTLNWVTKVHNFTLFLMGNNNQFLANIFFPDMEEERNNANRRVQMMKSEDYGLFYDEGFLVAMRRAIDSAPQHLRMAFWQARGELPSSYRRALHRSVAPGGGRSFAGTKMIPELINLVLPQLRQVTDNEPRLAKFRNYFFHIYGRNLKSVGQDLTGRAGNNPLLNIFTQYPVVAWEHANPNDIVFDLGLEILVDPQRLTTDVGHTTLLWDQRALERLSSPGWLAPRLDAYLHSFEVGGLRAYARKQVRCSGLVGVQYYHKESKQTRVHEDRSIGTGFTPKDAAGYTQRYYDEIERLKEAWTPESYGLRVEFRCGSWATRVLAAVNPRRWLHRFVEEQAILAYDSQELVHLKRLFLDAYTRSLYRQSRLDRHLRNMEHVKLLTAVLTYLIKGLIQRPDDMSSSREMARRLMITARSKKHGFPSVQGRMLSEDLVSLEGEPDPEDFRILRYMNRNKPAGARLKTSRAQAVQGPEGPEQVVAARALVSETENGSRPASTELGPMLAGQDREWVERLVNTDLAGWLWSRFPTKDKRRTGSAQLLRGPLRFRDWRQISTARHESRIRGAQQGFQSTIDTLFPPNWQQDRFNGAQWRTYQVEILDQCIERIDSRTGHDRVRYSAALRREIELCLVKWEYLPVPQKKKVWAFNNQAGDPTYAMFANPAIHI